MKTKIFLDSAKIDEIKKSHKIDFVDSTIFKKSLDRILKQSEF